MPLVVISYCIHVSADHHGKNGPAERTKKDEAATAGAATSSSASTSDYREKLFSAFSSTRKRRDRSLHLHYQHTSTEIDTLKPLHKSSSQQQRSVSWETSDTTSSKESMSLIWGSDRLSGL